MTTNHRIAIMKPTLTAVLLTPLALPGFACSASAQEALESFRAAARIR